MPEILIAEDNELNLKLMYDVLKSQGFSVDTALDGEAALEKLLNNKYDLLLLDLLMPKMSGFEVLEKLKEKNIKLTTLVVSACAMNEEISRAKALGCKDFITKPLRINDFLAAVKRNLS